MMNTTGLLPIAATPDDLAAEYGITTSTLLDWAEAGLKPVGSYWAPDTDYPVQIYAMTDLLHHAKDTE
ncbi:hypothetical protein [Rhodococcus wratislaviensis]|nr:hypothetical protein [Rhodococcus wratislaviensis]